MTARLTEDSLRTHGGLTHPLTEDSRLEVEGKGDRKWKGVRAEAFHHDYRKVDVRDLASIVAPSPVTTPDAMMSLTAIAHLDFEPEVPCEDLTATGESADYLAELAEWVAAECPELRRRMMICRKHFEEILPLIPLNRSRRTLTSTSLV